MNNLKLYWYAALGLQKVDNLKPSNYLLKQVKDNINGKINIRDIEANLTKYYNKQFKLNVKEKECDFVSARIVELLIKDKFVFDYNFIKDIHKYLFNDIYNFAGKYRTYNITKDEHILRNDTVIYTDYNMIESTLDCDFKEEIKRDYSKLDKNERIHHITNFTSRIWEVHPFGEGNTRTIALFIILYLKTLRFNINYLVFKEHSLYFRNALVRSNYSNKDIYPTNEYLINFFENLLSNGNHKLDNNDLYIDD